MGWIGGPRVHQSRHRMTNNTWSHSFVESKTYWSIRKKENAGWEGQRQEKEIRSVRGGKVQQNRRNVCFYNRLSKNIVCYISN